LWAKHSFEDRPDETPVFLTRIPCRRPRGVILGYS
jgi:hypothetical protein